MDRYQDNASHAEAQPLARVCDFMTVPPLSVFPHLWRPEASENLKHALGMQGATYVRP